MDQKKLYVGNLDYGVTREQLAELFAEIGTVVDTVVITDKFSGRSKGFGFVEMETDAAAQAAVTKFNEYDYNGRKLIVNVARPKAPREDRGGRGGGGRGGNFRSGGGDRGGQRGGGYGQSRGGYQQRGGSSQGYSRPAPSSQMDDSQQMADMPSGGEVQMSE